MPNEGKRILGDALFWFDKKGRCTLGRECYSYPNPERPDDLILRSRRTEASVRLSPGQTMIYRGVKTDTYELARTVLLPPDAEIPPEPQPYGAKPGEWDSLEPNPHTIDVPEWKEVADEDAWKDLSETYKEYEKSLARMWKLSDSKVEKEN